MESRGQPVTCLPELVEMMHSGYPGRAGRYKLSHIDFNKLEIPDIKDPVQQYILENTIKKQAMELATSEMMVGISPYVLNVEKYLVNGVEVEVKVPLVLKAGTYELFSALDTDTQDSIFTAKLRGGYRKEPRKVFFVRYPSCDGPSAVDGDVVDSPCGRLLPEYRRMKHRLLTASIALDRALYHPMIITNAPKDAKVRFTMDDLEKESSELVTAELEGKLKTVEVTKSGHLLPKQADLLFFTTNGHRVTVIPENYELAPFHPAPKELFETDGIVREFSMLVDSEFMVSGVRSVDSGAGGRWMSSSVSDTMAANMRKSLDTTVDDVTRGVKVVWKSATGESIDHLPIKLPSGRPLDLKMVAELVEKGLFPIARAREQVSKIARFTIQEGETLPQSVSRPETAPVPEPTNHEIDIPEQHEEDCE